MKHRILTALLLVGLLFTLSCGSGETPADSGETTGTEAPAADVLVLVGAGMACRITVPAGDSNALVVAYQLRTAILEATGVKLPVGKDSEPAQGCEILVGKTNRAASQEAYRSIGGAGDWLCAVSDGSLALAGGSTDALKTAMERLLADGLSGGGLSLPKAYAKGENGRYCTILRDGASDYVLIVGKKDSTAAGIAYTLRRELEEKTGVRLRQDYDGGTPGAKEILIGNTDRPESAAVRAKFVTGLDWYVGMVGDKLIIDGGDADALAHAAEWFLSTYLPGKTDLVSLPPELEQHYICKFEKPEEVAKLIDNTPGGDVKRLQSVERADVYTPTDAWFYSHHQAISKIGDRFIAVWSRGRWNEDDCGQHIAWSWSTDFTNWSEAAPLVDVRRGDHSELVMWVSGVYNTGDTLTVYFRTYEYGEAYLRENNTLRPIADEGRFSHTCWYLQTKDGITWTEPVQITDPPAYTAGGNHGPVTLSDGTLIWPGAQYQALTHDKTGLHWEERSGVDGAFALNNGAKIFTESSLYELDNGGVILLARSNAGRLWAAFSEDLGKTWSNPYPTHFTDAGAKFMCGRLPDGRYYVVSNPVPKSNRNPLCISLSKDGYRFDERYIIGDEPYTHINEGMYKDGDYGYPCTYIGDDGYFYVIYSRGKETVQVTRFLLSELG